MSKEREMRMGIQVHPFTTLVPPCSLDLSVDIRLLSQAETCLSQSQSCIQPLFTQIEII